MGAAKQRGNFEQRKQQSIQAYEVAVAADKAIRQAEWDAKTPEEQEAIKTRIHDAQVRMATMASLVSPYIDADMANHLNPFANTFKFRRTNEL